MSLLQDTQLNLKIILADEDKIIKEWEKRTREKLEPVFLQAAKKLEKHVDDKATICALLSKEWPHESRRLREYLPDDYKQTKFANKESDASPQGQMEEFLKTIADVMADGADVFKTLFDKYHHANGAMRKDFEIQLTEIFAGGAAPPIQDQLDNWKKYSIEMSHAKQEVDERTKIGKFYKILVRIQALYGTKSDVAKKARLTPKWYKNGIEMDPTIQENFNKLVGWLFPDDKVRAAEYADWFAKCLLLEDTDPDAKKPDPPTHLTHYSTV